MTRRSLRLRLFLVGALAIVAALIFAAGGLVLLFEHHVERTLDDDLAEPARQRPLKEAIKHADRILR